MTTQRVSFSSDDSERVYYFRIGKWVFGTSIFVLLVVVPALMFVIIKHHNEMLCKEKLDKLGK